MRESIKTGLCFGLTSGTITTLGLMVGLAAGTSSRIAVIGGIITIAVADALSDALGIHISEEAKKTTSENHVWEATITTFATKFLFALTFVVPVLLMDLSQAIIISVVWGILVLSIMSYSIGKDQGNKPMHVVFEHISIAILVILLTHQIGVWISQNFS
ncbi:MAG: hypothetical protein WC178_00960 [Candidatus Paceibacterota bacterium]